MQGEGNGNEVMVISMTQGDDSKDAAAVAAVMVVDGATNEKFTPISHNQYILMPWKSLKMVWCWLRRREAVQYDTLPRSLRHPETASET
ncbi:hypothetical protein E2C01_068128 [Portunus trituberculatus]|uniref:Uncharacterized protein n=1 Tax=Portunus trituberculatus TaxID=210409 RepID=A0A5B7HLM3_PORTR|nr:hypothetical protein [Portunus trituberculatus]